MFMESSEWMIYQLSFSDHLLQLKQSWMHDDDDDDGGGV